MANCYWVQSSLMRRRVCFKRFAGVSICISLAVDCFCICSAGERARARGIVFSAEAFLISGTWSLTWPTDAKHASQSRILLVLQIVFSINYRTFLPEFYSSSSSSIEGGREKGHIWIWWHRRGNKHRRVAWEGGRGAGQLTPGTLTLDPSNHISLRQGKMKEKEC